MNKKRLICTTLVSLLVVSQLAGCKKEATKPDAPADEAVTLSMLIGENGSRLGEDQTTLVNAELQERLNFKFDYVIGGTDNKQISEKLSLLVAGSKIPDLVTVMPNEIMKYPDKFVDLNEYKDKMPNLAKHLEDPEVRRAITNEDGKILYAPSITKSKVAITYMIRKDWLDKLNLEVPKTLDQYYNVMKAFANEDPNGNGEKDEIGYYPQGVKWWLPNFSYCYNSAPWNMIKGNEVVFGPLQPGYKDALQFLNKLYKEKLIDQQFITSTGKELEQYVATGKIGFSQAFNNRVEQFNNWSQKDDPNAQWEIILPPTAPDGKLYEQSQNPKIGIVALAVNKDSKNIEKALELIDYLYSDEGKLLTTYGVEGDTYTMVDGKPKYTDKVLKNDKFTQSRDVKIYYGLEGGFTMVQDPESFIYADEVMDGVKLYMDNEEMYDNMKPAPPTSLTISYTDEESPLTTKKWFEINTYKEEQTYKFIMGTRSFDEWDDFIAEMKNMGIDDCMKAYTAAYQRYLSK